MTIKTANMCELKARRDVKAEYLRAKYDELWIFFTSFCAIFFLFLPKAERDGGGGHCRSCVSAGAWRHEFAHLRTRSRARFLSALRDRDARARAHLSRSRDSAMNQRLLNDYQNNCETFFRRF